MLENAGSNARLHRLRRRPYNYLVNVDVTRLFDRECNRARDSERRDRVLLKRHYTLLQIRAADGLREIGLNGSGAYYRDTNTVADFLS
jgi:hypothetical protein